MGVLESSDHVVSTSRLYFTAILDNGQCLRLISGISNYVKQVSFTGSQVKKVVRMNQIPGSC